MRWDEGHGAHRVIAAGQSGQRHARTGGDRAWFPQFVPRLVQEHGYPRNLAERALAHTISNKGEAAYHRTDLLEQRRPMMLAWAEYCMGDGDKIDGSQAFMQPIRPRHRR